MANSVVVRRVKQRSDHWLDALLSNAAYAAVQVLIRVAPRPNNNARQRPLRHHHASRLPVAWFVHAYQRSGLRDRLKSEGRACVYLPSCTDYAERAVLTYGLFRGLLLTGDRFRRCSEGGQGSYVDFP